MFNPLSGSGIILAGVSVVLFGAAGVRCARQLGGRPARRRPRAEAGKPAAVKPASRKGAPAIDDDMAEIEALLRKRGIS